MTTPMTRRHYLQYSACTAAAGLGSIPSFAAPKLQTRRIPAVRESLPVVGIGTNRFRLEIKAQLAQVLTEMVAAGGAVIDTAAAYGESEEVIGQVISELGLRKQVFLATKLIAPTAPATTADLLARALQRLRTDTLDLMQVHNMSGTAEVMPLLREWKTAGKIRYLGLSTSRASQHGQIVDEMQRYAVDFIQVDYSLANRAVETMVLPAAQKAKIAVLVNLPLGGGRGQNLIAQVAGRELPSWVRRHGIASWSQFFLSFVLAHPAVTCVIPGSTKLEHLRDNQAAARIAPLKESQRLRMIEYWQSIAPAA